MSIFVMTALGTKGLIQLNSQNGSLMGGQAYLAVGAPFNLAVAAPLFGACATWKITKIVVQYTGSVGWLLRQKDYDTGERLTETTLQHSIHDSGGTTDTINLSPVVSVISINFYVGIPKVSNPGAVTTDTLKVTVDYDSGAQDVANFVVNMQLSTMTMDMVWPTTSDTKFDFTPYKYFHSLISTDVYDNIRIAWNDANYVKGIPFGQNYALGASAQGNYWPFQWSGSGQNTTDSDGVFYCVQVVEISGLVQKEFSTDRNRDIISTFPLSTAEYSPDNPFILDNFLLRPIGPDPYPWSFFAQVTADSNGPLLDVPLHGSVVDGNLNPVNYYGDGPSTGWADVSVIRNVYYSNHDNTNFKTYFVFHPLAGIPIAMKYWNWGFVTNEENATASSTLKWADGATVQGNWVGATTLTTPTLSNGPVYVEWLVVYGDEYNTTFNSFEARRFSKLLASNRPNGAPMGGAVAIDANTGRGLPMKLAGNVAVMNTVL